MPRGRVIDKRISRSEKFAKLRFERSRTLYCMALAHLDVDGRLWADPKEIKLDVCPLLSWSHNQIVDSLEDLVKVGLITVYGDKNLSIPVLQYAAFHKMNKPRIRDEAPSRFAPPPKHHDYTGSKPVLNRLRVRVRVREEKKKRRGGIVRKSLLIYLDARAREWKNITTADMDLWKKAYPNCDIELELYRMMDWCIRNWTTSSGTPGKGQKKNWPAFIRNWLAGEEKEGGTRRFRAGTGKLPPTLAAWVKKPEEGGDA